MPCFKTINCDKPSNFRVERPDTIGKFPHHVLAFPMRIHIYIKHLFFNYVDVGDSIEHMYFNAMNWFK